MQNWDDLKFCLALERYTTMTAAAKALGTNVATVSRRIERMTEQAGQPLFVRDQTQWVATALGKNWLIWRGIWKRVSNPLPLWSVKS